MTSFFDAREPDVIASRLRFLFDSIRGPYSQLVYFDTSVIECVRDLGPLYEDRLETIDRMVDHFLDTSADLRIFEQGYESGDPYTVTRH